MRLESALSAGEALPAMFSLACLEAGPQHKLEWQAGGTGARALPPLLLDGAQAWAIDPEQKSQGEILPSRLPSPPTPNLPPWGRSVPFFHEASAQNLYHKQPGQSQPESLLLREETDLRLGVRS